ncbi:MAG: fused MFS/spermidine synthase [Verrucomicrobiaceae bacterium]|nr:fused MFS/spermidine synthase [Verrucomicrobiaceae bacterium]
MVFDRLKDKPDARFGVVGMGAGTVAAYAEKGQVMRFYELNPAAEKLAFQWFTYIPDMIARGARYEVALGDARLSMEHEAPQQFDALLLDAFSGDTVPVHLLTKESFGLYLRHMKPDGVIAVHITNHFLNLAPVVEKIAAELGIPSVRIAVKPPPDTHNCITDYVLMSRDQAFVQSHPPQIPTWARVQDVPVWTDHHHNLFGILQHW